MVSGMKLGVFADGGTRTCGGAAASYGFEHVDAQTFADWGLSYLKYDNCNAPDTDPCAPLLPSTLHACMCRRQKRLRHACPQLSMHPLCAAALHVLPAYLLCSDWYWSCYSCCSVANWFPMYVRRGAQACQSIVALTAGMSGCRLSVQIRFEVMRDALNETGRPFVYAIDDWGVTNTWNYGAVVRPVPGTSDHARLPARTPLLGLPAPFWHVSLCPGW